VATLRHAAARGLVLLALALLPGGCALGGRSFGQYADDTRLTGKIKVSLAGLHLSHLRRVNVDVYESVVYLSGAVDSALEKSDAEIAAWTVKGVRQVVNDLVIRGGERDAVAALPASTRGHQALDRFSWVTRVERPRPGGPEEAYDASGRLVATLYTLSSRELIEGGFMTLPTDGRPVDHVSVHTIPVRDDVPDPQVVVVLWYVREPVADR
jgi:hyperosmotically inducible protein